MDLHRGIEFIRRLEKELVLFNLDERDPLVDRMNSHFDTQNVRIRSERTSSGVPQVSVLSHRDEVLAITTISLLRRLTSPESTDDGTVGISDADYQELLGHLKETTFSSYDTTDMLYASREIEDRAHRVGNGTIHAGFQRVGVIRDQRAIYVDLAKQGVEVHAYGIPDAEPPDIGSGRVHAVETSEIARTWFVIFDGGGRESQKSALIAEENDDGEFYGAWTYDPTIVDLLCDHLERTYVTEAHTT